MFENKEDAGRAGIATACQAVARFLWVTGQSPLLAAPLLALRAAILDLEQGVANPIIRPDAADGRRSRSALKKHASTVAAVCLEALVDLGDPVNETASRIARLAASWSTWGDQQINADTIKNWRNTIRAMRADEHQRVAFDLMRKDLLEHGGRQEVERLLSDGPPGMPKT
ncbi:hypothetical protein H8B02_22745 [Bradyrhizobium sp. Pear77]|uniref:hypothetical protein n=1 Tax=Bradyrhizobium altum TaxID=1571202 RepID=UPI001E5537B9|nr:hypothetical protein [Bradyrhizobium altum]MCC8956144.1 hypothetical protein [Bradyrhizobium altum]